VREETRKAESHGVLFRQDSVPAHASSPALLVATRNSGRLNYSVAHHIRQT